jgi:hypothetical protein
MNSQSSGQKQRLTRHYPVLHEHCKYSKEWDSSCTSYKFICVVLSKMRLFVHIHLQIGLENEVHGWEILSLAKIQCFITTERRKDILEEISSSWDSTEGMKHHAWDEADIYAVCHCSREEARTNWLVQSQWSSNETMLQHFLVCLLWHTYRYLCT